MCRKCEAAGTFRTSQLKVKRVFRFALSYTITVSKTQLKVFLANVRIIDWRGSLQRTTRLRALICVRFILGACASASAGARYQVNITRYCVSFWHNSILSFLTFFFYLFIVLLRWFRRKFVRSGSTPPGPCRQNMSGRVVIVCQDFV